MDSYLLLTTYYKQPTYYLLLNLGRLLAAVACFWAGSWRPLGGTWRPVAVQFSALWALGALPAALGALLATFRPLLAALAALSGHSWPLLRHF